MPQHQPALMTHPLTYARLQQGWSYRGAARKLAEAASALGINQARGGSDKFWRWEKEGVTPDADSQRALAHALGVPAKRVALLPWPRWLPGAEDAFGAQAWTIAGCLAALEEVEDAVVDRRGFLTLSSVALAGVASGWASVEPERAVAAAQGGHLDDETVTWVEERIPGLRRMDDRLSGQSVLRLVVADLHMISELLSHSSYPDVLGRRLYAVAGELGQLAGWIAFDLGQHAAAQRYYTAGLHAAHAADDRQLGANILAGMSFQCALAGSPHDGIALAQTAQDQARDARPRVRALLASRTARAAARAHDTTTCMSALNEADRLLDAADATHPAEDPAWIYYFDRAELHAQAGACFSDLDQPKDAEPLLAQALDTQDRSYVRDRTIYLIRAARTHLQAGHLDAACDLAGQAATLAHRSYSPRSTTSVTDFRASLTPWNDSPHVTALDEHLTALA
ncbi:hypothetical protein [Streptomyces sp. B6B3]|uniref:hypothetical protein n=1 Tax=Streptomyces sp. B6B3 TaxID=3153570 RepID=UPI00325CAA0D